MEESGKLVFVDNSGVPTGAISADFFSPDDISKLHLAFSCYIFRRIDNNFLVSRRSLHKPIWPGAWSNSLCGHPLANEKMEDAIPLCAKKQLVINVLEDISCVRPSYRNTAPAGDQIKDNDFCPLN